MTEQLLDLLLRSRRAPSITGSPVEIKLIRLSQLRAEGGPAVAVAKVARDPQGAKLLHAQRRLVAQVACQPGIDTAWRQLVPRVLAFDERPDATVCVETYRPGARCGVVSQQF